MKKLLAIVLSVVCVLSFSACDNDNGSSESSTTTATTTKKTTVTTDENIKKIEKYVSENIEYNTIFLEAHKSSGGYTVTGKVDSYYNGYSDYQKFANNIISVSQEAEDKFNTDITVIAQYDEYSYNTSNNWLVNGNSVVARDIAPSEIVESIELYYQEKEETKPTTTTTTTKRATTTTKKATTTIKTTTNSIEVAPVLYNDDKVTVKFIGVDTASYGYDQVIFWVENNTSITMTITKNALSFDGIELGGLSSMIEHISANSAALVTATYVDGVSNRNPSKISGEFEISCSVDRTDEAYYYSYEAPFANVSVK